MKFPIRESNKRLKIDKQNMEIQIKRGLTCPKCSSSDELKLRTKMHVNVDMYCDYKIECQKCGYEQGEWFDTSSEAIEALRSEGLIGMIHE